MLEINELAETLHEQRLGAVEATALLRTVMEQIDVAVFAFDPRHRLRLVNRAGERLLGRRWNSCSDARRRSCRVSDWFGDAPRIVDISPAGRRPGRWEVRRTTFRQGGLPHELLVLADVSRPLRDEERQAWQRLIRVIGHELNNSLAPIKSIAGSLETLLHREPPPDDWREDMQRGLQVIALARGFAEPLHGGLRAAGAAAGAEAGAGGPEAAGAARRRPRDARAGHVKRRPGRDASTPTPISSSSC